MLPSAEQNAVMALSGDRTNAGALPEAANDGMHLLAKPLDMKAITAELRDPNYQALPAMREAMDRLRALRAENAKLDGPWPTPRSRPHAASAAR
jgi:hypothetical protein